MSKVETIGGVAVGNKPKYHPEMWYPFTLYRGEEAEKGWQHVKPLKARHVTPTKIVSTDCESSWTMYDKQIINPEEWGKTNERWTGGLRDWPEPEVPREKQLPSWKGVNYQRWPLKRQPKYNRSGVEVTL